MSLLPDEQNVGEGEWNPGKSSWNCGNITQDQRQLLLT